MGPPTKQAVWGRSEENGPTGWIVQKGYGKHNIQPRSAEQHLRMHNTSNLEVQYIWHRLGKLLILIHQLLID